MSKIIVSYPSARRYSQHAASATGHETCIFGWLRCNREYDELLQAADQYTRPFSIEEQEEITSFKPDDMAIAMNEGKWILVRITEVIDDGKFYCHAFNTYQEKRRLGDREYFPVYTNARGQEKYTDAPNANDEPWDMEFSITDLQYYPFTLVNRRIPHEITRKLFADKMVNVILSFREPTKVLCEPIAEAVIPELDDGNVFMIPDSCPYL